MLHSFNLSVSDGTFPSAGLIADSSGNLYGTTFNGGGSGCGFLGPGPGCGVAFKLSPDGTSYKVLHAFAGGASDGGGPGKLLADGSGNLYGTTFEGGGTGCGLGGPPPGPPPGCGVVFKLSPEGTYKVLHSFGGSPSDGASPSNLLADGSGNLYGTTANGGASGRGVVFKLLPDGSSYKILHSFAGGASDGSAPIGALFADSNGNLYGTTLGGGGTTGCFGQGCGVVFKLSADGTYKVLHSFTGGASDGANPVANLIADSSGNLFGTTLGGGGSTSCGGGATSGCGVVFKLSPDGTSYKVLHFFTGGASDGGLPLGNLIADNSGNLYGTTDLGGGIGCAGGCGTVFKLAPDGTSYKVLHSFAGFPSDGANPITDLIADSSGNLYGTTGGGGGADSGTVFKLTGTGFVTTPPCSSRDATLTNLHFITTGGLVTEVTFDFSSPRTMSSIKRNSSTNISSLTPPSIVAGGHSATGGDAKKADATKKASFLLEIDFASGTPSACLIDPHLKGGHHLHHYESGASNDQPSEATEGFEF